MFAAEGKFLLGRTAAAETEESPGHDAPATFLNLARQNSAKRTLLPAVRSESARPGCFARSAGVAPCYRRQSACVPCAVAECAQSGEAPGFQRRSPKWKHVRCPRHARCV